MKDIKKLVEGLLNEEGLDVSPATTMDGLLGITINGKDYKYEPKGIDIAELIRKFNKIRDFSKGRALAWLKKNSILKSKEEPKVESFDERLERLIILESDTISVVAIKSGTIGGAPGPIMNIEKDKKYEVQTGDKDGEYIVIIDDENKKKFSIGAPNLTINKKTFEEYFK